MIIPPPRDDVQIDEIAEFTPDQYEYIKQRLNKPTWLCPKCGLTNHHYNQQCARCKCEKLLEIQEHGGKEL